MSQDEYAANNAWWAYQLATLSDVMAEPEDVVSLFAFIGLVVTQSLVITGKTSSFLLLGCNRMVG
ncbi:MAG: hypothetical protein U0103_16915 [Candidatus Obscuribacterales bacterium]